MRITIITLFPQMLSGFFQESIIKRAVDKGLADIEVINLRDFALDSYGTVDGRPYGGGAGMVLRVEPIQKAIEKSKMQNVNSNTNEQNQKILLTSAKGKAFNQKKAQELSKLDHLIFIAGHYEGVDERILEYVDEEISIGDFVLTGGEIPIAAIVDSVVRLLPGVLKKEEATQEESFFQVPVEELISIVGRTETLERFEKLNKKCITLLEYPQFTRPEMIHNQKVPEELLSGDHKKVREFRLKEAYKETVKKRPDLLDI